MHVAFEMAYLELLPCALRPPAAPSSMQLLPPASNGGEPGIFASRNGGGKEEKAFRQMGCFGSIFSPKTPQFGAAGEGVTDLR